MSSAVTVSNADVRARILKDLYERMMKQEEPLGNEREYASSIGISETLAKVNLQYLVESNLVKGEVIFSPGTTKPQTVIVSGLTSYGIEAVEGVSRRKESVSWNLLGPIIGSNVAIGDKNIQTLTFSINNFDQLYRYLDDRLEKLQADLLRPIIKEIEDGINKGSLKPSTLKKLGETAQTVGSVAGPIIEAILRLLGLKV